MQKQDQAYSARELENICVIMKCNTAGAYLGGAIGPWPPLWVARIAKLHRKVSKIEACPPPPFASWASGLSSKSPNIWVKDEIIGRKMGRNVSEDLFFFCFSLVFGENMGRILSEDLFLLFTCFWGKYGTNFE